MLRKTLSKYSRWLHVPDIFGLIGLLLVIILAFRSELFFNKMLWLDDLITSFYPVRTYTTQIIREGRLPLWTPYLWGGFPLFADSIAAPLHPLHLAATLINNPLTAFIGLYIAYVIFAGLCMYILARTLHLNPAAALISAMILVLGGFFVSQMNHMNIMATALWLPAQCLMIEKYLQKRRLRFIGWGALLVGLQALSGHSQIILMSGLGLLTFAGLRALPNSANDTASCSNHKARQTKSRIQRTVFAVGCMIVIGLGSGAIQLLPFAELFTSSQRTLGNWNYYQATQLSYPLPALINLIFPNVFHHELSFVAYNELYGYVGSVGLMLALSAVVLPHQRRRLAIGAALLALFFLLSAMGQYTPIYRLIYQLPGFRSARVPARFLYLFGFYIALLAGFGAQALIESENLPAIRRLGQSAIWGALLLTVSIIVLRGIIIFYPEKLSNTLHTYLLTLRDVHLPPPAALYDFLLKTLTLYQWDIALPILFLALTGAALMNIHHTSHRRQWRCGLLMLAILSSLCGADFYPRELRSDVEALLQTDTTMLTTRLTPKSLERVDSRTTLLEVNGTLPHYLTQATGYTFVRPTRLHEFAQYSESELCHNKLLDLWGIRYLLVKKAAISPLSEQDCGYRIVEDGTMYALLENLDPLPRAFLVGRVIAASDPAQIPLTLLESNVDWTSSAIVEGPAVSQLLETELKYADVQIIRYEDQVVEIATMSDTPALLVLTDSYYPGWRATINGQRTPIYRTNYWFRGVFVPAGQHQVQFEYAPLAFQIGLAITLISLLIALGLMTWEWLPRLITIGFVILGIVVISIFVVDWHEVKHIWDTSATLTAHVQHQLQTQYPDPPQALRFYFSGTPWVPGPAMTLTGGRLSEIQFDRIYPGRRITGTSQGALADLPTTIPPPWERSAGMVAYWLANGTFILTPYIYDDATSGQLIDLQTTTPATGRPLAVFGDLLELHDTGLITQTFQTSRAAIGGAFLQTAWQLRAPTDQRYTVYIHFTLPDGELFAQADHGLAVWSGKYNEIYTDQWPSGILLRDYVALPVGVHQASFPLDVRIGVWIPETGEHLPVTSSDLLTDEHGRLIISTNLEWKRRN